MRGARNGDGILELWHHKYPSEGRQVRVPLAVQFDEKELR